MNPHNLPELNLVDFLVPPTHMKESTFGVALSFRGIFVAKRASLGIPYASRKIKRINPDFELLVAYEVGALRAMLVPMCGMGLPTKLATCHHNPIGLAGVVLMYTYCNVKNRSNLIMAHFTYICIC